MITLYIITVLFYIGREFLSKKVQKMCDPKNAEFFLTGFEAGWYHCNTCNMLCYDRKVKKEIRSEWKPLHGKTVEEVYQ